jgi:3'-phosphoadenosine 5'-phosphosulfate sulfotransferase (PAPS reductase)/FAD synthetase
MRVYDLLGKPDRAPRFVIFSSYGNDSVALIQWAHETGLKDVAVVFSDTKWAVQWWMDRVDALEWWVHSLIGFWTDRTESIGFAELARQKKAFPTQQFQWCSAILKIEPGSRWLEKNDPDKRAVCLVGVRREEGLDRANFPRYLAKSENHGGRVMLAPFADFTAEDRDALLHRAGVKPLPHRSMECGPCINSNRKDLRETRPEDLARAKALEDELNALYGLTKNGKPRTFFRPHRHMGAVGIEEVKRWADSDRGKFRANGEVAPDDLPPEKDEWTCNNGYCAN